MVTPSASLEQDKVSVQVVSCISQANAFRTLTILSRTRPSRGSAKRPSCRFFSLSYSSIL